MVDIACVIHAGNVYHFGSVGSLENCNLL